MLTLTLKNSDFQRVMEGLSLKEAIMDRHGKSGPSKFCRNWSATPVDGIWISPGLQINAGGYFPYDIPISNMEHRCTWIDFLFTQAFGHNVPAIIRPKARRLQPKDPWFVKNFVDCYRKLILDNCILDRVKKLEDQLRYPLPLSLQKEYEELEKFCTTAVATAERKCRKLRMGQVAFSPAIGQARLLIQAWSLLDKRSKGLKISSRFLHQTLKKANLDTSCFSLPAASVSLQLKDAYRNYYALKSSHLSLREGSLHEWATVLSLAGNSDKETKVRRLQQRERQRSSARKIRYLRGKLSTGSTTLVTVQQGQWVDLTSKHEIEKAIVQNNSDKFRQSFHTPFMVPPLKHLFGFKGLTSSAQAVLSGVYEPPDHLDSLVKDLLNELCTPDHVRHLGKHSVDLTMASYQAF